MAMVGEGSPLCLLGDRRTDRHQNLAVTVTDRALGSEHRVKLERVVNGCEYMSYQCTCHRCFRNAVTCEQAVPKATVLHGKMLLGFPLGSLSLCSYSPRIPGCYLVVHQPASLSTVLPRPTSTRSPLLEIKSMLPLGVFICCNSSLVQKYSLSLK